VGICYDGLVSRAVLLLLLGVMSCGRIGFNLQEGSEDDASPVDVDASAELVSAVGNKGNLTSATLATFLTVPTTPVLGAAQSAARSAPGPAGKIAAAIPACPHCGGVMRIVGCMPHSFHRPGPRAPPPTSAPP
jgi:hypothetical protein